MVSTASSTSNGRAPRVSTKSPSDSVSHAADASHAAAPSLLSSTAPSLLSSTAPLIAGLSGGAASTALLYPLDLVKVRLQVNEDPRRGVGGSDGTSLPKGRRRPRTMLCTLRTVVRHEGVLGLYQGLSPALVGSAVSWGGYFFLYEGIKQRWAEQRFRRNDSGHGGSSLGPAEHFVASCLAGAVMVLITNPVWLIKTRMQLQMKRLMEKRGGAAALVAAAGDGGKEAIKPPYRSMADAARTIIREEGPLALYKGAVPAMMLVSHGGVQFVTYEFLKKHFGEYTKSVGTSGVSGTGRGSQGQSGTMERLRNSMGYLTMGAVSKMVASTTTYPLQVVKARLQQRSQAVEVTETGEITVMKREYGGVIDCVTRILRKEGPVGFFKGCLPNALRVAPGAAVTFVTYESVMDLLR